MCIGIRIIFSHYLPHLSTCHPCRSFIKERQAPTMRTMKSKRTQRIESIMDKNNSSASSLHTSHSRMNVLLTALETSESQFAEESISSLRDFFPSSPTRQARKKLPSTGHESFSSMRDLRKTMSKRNMLKKEASTRVLHNNSLTSLLFSGRRRRRSSLNNADTTGHSDSVGSLTAPTLPTIARHSAAPSCRDVLKLQASWQAIKEDISDYGLVITEQVLWLLAEKDPSTRKTWGVVSVRSDRFKHLATFLSDCLDALVTAAGPLMEDNDWTYYQVQFIAEGLNPRAVSRVLIQALRASAPGIPTKDTAAVATWEATVVRVLRSWA